MSPNSLHGTIPALITPFGSDGGVDESAYGKLLDHVIAGGVPSVIVGGGTGEFVAMSHEERRRALEFVIAHVDGRIPVVAQTGAMSTRDAVDLSTHAAGAGASALMLGVPYYEPLNRTQVLTYFGEVAKASALPLMVYNYPTVSGVTFDVELLAPLVDAVPSVQYLKDSGGDLMNSAAVSDHFGDRLPVFSGFDWQSGPALLLGASGVVNGAANVVPEQFVAMCNAAATGDSAAVTDIWLRLLPFLRYIVDHPYVSVIKSACRIIGLPMGAVRAPLEELDAAEYAELEKILAGI